MRKLHKNRLLELVDTLDSACAELKRQQGTAFVNLCADIQDFTMSIFSYAESVLGEDARLVKLLDGLYELLYRVSQGEAGPKDISKAAYMIKSEVAGLQPDTFEIAFFCYKASMSDCFESVYFAAREDPACDPYFIPIPYYDRNPDTSFGQMHLEGEGCYPPEYELTDWREYDVEARRPDVIFIMNPYDDQNYVTSVHPDFYSKRLKEYTDCLVYIEYGLQYWVYRNPCADDATSFLRESNNFLPGLLNCDYYIAYSKEVAASFIIWFNLHPEVMDAQNLSSEDVKHKFVALGSPKFDKVLSDVRNNFMLPKEWSTKTHEKKVFLFNTSIGELIKSSSGQGVKEHAQESVYLKKLRSVLLGFSNQEDSILWWRPHPLFESTLRSMRPGLLEEYLSIVREFKDSGTGIFDETEDLHRAIACSDALISDESSLLWMYTATGKPFYIPAITKALPSPVYNNDNDFHTPLDGRLANMRFAKGANIGDWNCCIWWDSYLEDDLMRNTCFKNYVERFIDFVVHPEKYPETDEYKRLQIQMFKDFVSNPDGTAGQKIYEFARQKALM